MNGIIVTWPQLAFIALIVAFIYIAELLLFIKKTAQFKPKPQRDTVDRQSLNNELSIFKQELHQLREQVAKLEQHEEAVPMESAYRQAIKLAKQGMDSAAVAAGCGISRGEAELIVALYRAANRS